MVGPPHPALSHGGERVLLAVSLTNVRSLRYREVRGTRRTLFRDIVKRIPLTLPSPARGEGVSMRILKGLRTASCSLSAHLLNPISSSIAEFVLRRSRIHLAEA